LSKVGRSLAINLFCDRLPIHLLFIGLTIYPSRQHW
jgi:hypothetical protein